jgi:hypothetical protein
MFHIILDVIGPHSLLLRLYVLVDAKVMRAVIIFIIIKTGPSSRPSSEQVFPHNHMNCTATLLLLTKCFI